MASRTGVEPVLNRAKCVNLSKMNFTKTRKTTRPWNVLPLNYREIIWCERWESNPQNISATRF